MACCCREQAWLADLRVLCSSGCARSGGAEPRSWACVKLQMPALSLVEATWAQRELEAAARCTLSAWRLFTWPASAERPQPGVRRRDAGPGAGRRLCCAYGRQARCRACSGRRPARPGEHALPCSWRPCSCCCVELYTQQPGPSSDVPVRCMSAGLCAPTWHCTAGCAASSSSASDAGSRGAQPAAARQPAAPA